MIKYAFCTNALDKYYIIEYHIINVYAYITPAAIKKGMAFIPYLQAITLKKTSYKKCDYVNQRWRCSPLGFTSIGDTFLVSQDYYSTSELHLS